MSSQIKLFLNLEGCSHVKKNWRGPTLPGPFLVLKIGSQLFNLIFSDPEIGGASSPLGDYNPGFYEGKVKHIVEGS